MILQNEKNNSNWIYHSFLSMQLDNLAVLIYNTYIMKISNVTEEIPTCPDCSKELTPEERLLQAIFDDRQVKCQACHLKAKLRKCTKCGEYIKPKSEVYYEDQPYHAPCLAKFLEV